MPPLNLIAVFLTARLAELRRDHDEDNDRGDIVQTVIIVAAFAAAAIAICAVLIAKARGAANGVQTQ